MIQIDAQYVERVRSAKSGADLHDLLQGAIELEHSTIPPYLTAMISLKPGMNREIEELIRSVVIEEMLHMTVACNVLNALDGTPKINTAKFIPDYPGPLPMNIGPTSLIVGLEPFSKTLVEKTFMVIEEPENPIHFPVKAFALAEQAQYATIGTFYTAIIDKIKELGEKIFLHGDAKRQVANNHWFSAEELFPITNVETAVYGLSLIVQQGEGTPESPVDPEGELAHYYRFAEIFHGKLLVKDPAEKLGYSYSGAPVPFDELGVFNLKPNTKAEDLPENTEQRRQANEFNYTYGKLLNSLHITFNGRPGHLDTTFGLMYDLKLIGGNLATMEYPGAAGFAVGPPFDYARVDV